MNNQELAQKILEVVGPAENVIEAHNCMTRLRLHVHRETFTAEALKKIPERHKDVINLEETEAYILRKAEQNTW